MRAIETTVISASGTNANPVAATIVTSHPCDDSSNPFVFASIATGRAQINTSAASKNPRKSDPASPIKIFARGKFWVRNPTVAPAATRPTPNTNDPGAKNQLIPAIPTNPTLTAAAAVPSMLSSMLTAFITVTIHNSAITESTGALPVISTPPQIHRNAHAHPHCAANFAPGRK